MYVVLARKWRPAQFSDIVGQGPVVRTLINAITGQRLHHAYLFTGTRGIGKTSIARIFAKAIRCENLTITPEKDVRSCGTCGSCREVVEGSGNMNVLEIDGASNNGVEAVREIREGANTLPLTGKYKIYIIDEVHMLTTQAFNALLKTLEEPPAHVLFILATTEPHKIPATILSRCQRFDFRRVNPTQTQARIHEILNAEKVEFDPAATALIARAAEGSMRDALSLLDQSIAFCGSRLTEAGTREALGLIEGQTVLGLVRAILEHKPQPALTLIQRAYEVGHDLRELGRSVIEALHAVLLAQVGATDQLQEGRSEEAIAELKALAALRPIEELELIFQIFHYGLDSLARSAQPKIVFDLLAIKAAAAETLLLVDTTVPAATSSPVARRAQAPQTPVSYAPPPAHFQEVPPPTDDLSPVKRFTAALSASISAQGAGSNPASTTAAVAAKKAAAQPSVAPVRPMPPSGPKTWEGFVAFVDQARPRIASLLEHSNGVTLPQKEGDHFQISFLPSDQHRIEQLKARPLFEVLNQIAQDYFGKPIRFEFFEKADGESMAARLQRERQETEKREQDALLSHPLVLEARALFGNTITIEHMGGSRDR